MAAWRSGELVVVSFTDTGDQPRKAAEVALRESQAREKAARAEADQEHQHLQATLNQAPVAIGYFEGPDLVVTAVNSELSAILGPPPAQLLGQPLFDNVPELCILK